MALGMVIVSPVRHVMDKRSRSTTVKAFLDLVVLYGHSHPLIAFSMGEVLQSDLGQVPSARSVGLF